MGYMRHHAIIVTSWDLKKLANAREQAKQFLNANDLPITMVTEMTPELMNGYSSFLVAPDGSKEGWSHSDQGDTFRTEYVQWLNDQAYEDGSSVYTWALVQYGDDNDDNRLLDSDATLSIASQQTEMESRA